MNVSWPIRLQVVFGFARTIKAWATYGVSSTYEALVQHVEASEYFKLLVNLPSFTAARPEGVGHGGVNGILQGNKLKLMSLNFRHAGATTMAAVCG